MKGFLEFPLIILNFKSYLEATGINAVKLSKIAEKIYKKTNVVIIVAPQHTDIFRVAMNVEIPVFAQHVDSISPGSHTGYVTMEAIKEAGATGTIINHSEHLLKLSDIDLIVREAKRLNLITCTCASTPAISKAIATLSPDIVAIEPPELIGTGIAVSKAKPEIIKQTIKSVNSVNPDIPVICGAGISSGEDVYTALELGAKGVLLASSFIKAKDPEKILSQMVDAVIKYIRR